MLYADSDIYSRICLCLSGSHLYAGTRADIQGIVAQFVGDSRDGCEEGCVEGLYVRGDAMLLQLFARDRRSRARAEKAAEYGWNELRERESRGLGAGWGLGRAIEGVLAGWDATAARDGAAMQIGGEGCRRG